VWQTNISPLSIIKGQGLAGTVGLQGEFPAKVKVTFAKRALLVWTHGLLVDSRWIAGKLSACKQTYKAGGDDRFEAKQGPLSLIGWLD
jgi:hypothetical protein